MGPSEMVTIGYVAQRYYRDGLSRTEIADELTLSRFKIARMLDAARELGVVTITITAPDSLDLDLSIALRERFGLQRAIVVHAPTASELAIRESLAEAAARLVSEIVEDGDVLGLTAGRTLTAMTKHLRRIGACEVVQLAGVAGPARDNGVEVVREVGRASGGRTRAIYAPLIVASSETASALRREPTILSTLRRFDAVTKAFVAIGSWQPPDSQMYDNAKEVGVLDELLAQGVQAEVCSIVLSADGTILPGVADRSIGITAKQLRAIPEVIAVAGGTIKTAAIAAALRSGLVDSLVTDATAARALIAL
jgi:DNA-binding transcriptional regulator LsrR (DeoR family)